MNDQKNHDDQPGNEPDLAPASADVPEEAAAPSVEVPEHAEQPAAFDAPPATDAQSTPRRFLPSTPAGRTRLAAAGIAAAFFLGGGLGGYAIGQAGDGSDHNRMSRPDGFDGRGGPGGPGGGMQGGPGQQQGQQQAPDSSGGTSGSGTAS